MNRYRSRWGKRFQNILKVIYLWSLLWQYRFVWHHNQFPSYIIVILWYFHYIELILGWIWEKIGKLFQKSWRLYWWRIFAWMTFQQFIKFKVHTFRIDFLMYYYTEMLESIYNVLLCIQKCLNRFLMYYYTEMLAKVVD